MIKTEKSFQLIILLTIIFSGLLIWKTYPISFWPTDSYFFYLPAARAFFDLPYPSELHNIAGDTSLGALNLHGKEFLILCIALTQNILNDPHSLFPNILPLIFCYLGSSLLIYMICRNLLGAFSAFITALIFLSTFWNVQYVLIGAHQPLILFLFLFSTHLLLKSQKGFICPSLAGFCWGLAVFSSPTIPFYFPYWLLILIYVLRKNHVSKENKTMVPGILLFISFGTIPFLYFLWPDPLWNLKGWILFLKYSQEANHFDFYRDYLNTQLPMVLPHVFRGEGWLWIIKYLFTIIPFLFIGYLASAAYLLIKGRGKSYFLWIVIVSFSTPIMTETLQISQLGRNYYSWFIGMSLVIALAIRCLSQVQHPPLRRKIFIGIGILLSAHIVHNAGVFLNDVWPTRMGTAHIRKYLDKNNIHEIIVPENHLNTDNVAGVLNHGGRETKIKIYQSRHFTNLTDSWVIVPPKTGLNIWRDCASPDETKIYPGLEASENRLAEQAQQVFPTMASSRIWILEEEVCAYRSLGINQITDKDYSKGMAYLIRK